MKLSIITVNLNNAIGLSKTVESVFSQSTHNFEYIIVDGLSSDGSVDIIHSLEKSNTQTKEPVLLLWLSEKDTGIYNAMNKGIKMAQGDYLLFLNSGDVLHDESVIDSFLKADVVADVVTGIECMSHGVVVNPVQNDKLTYSYMYNDTLLHQSTFIRRDAFDKYGMYSEDYRIVSDWEWFFRVLIKEDASYQTLDFIVTDFDNEGISNSDKYRELKNKERESVHSSILPRVRVDYNEMCRLQLIEKEYKHLKDGKFGWIISLILNIKGMHKK